MHLRSEWVQRIESAWRQWSVIWLEGVRRAGKTVLCRSLVDVEYLLEVRHVSLKDLMGEI